MESSGLLSENVDSGLLWKEICEAWCDGAEG